MGDLHDPSNPWKTLDSRVVYNNAWISTREDQVLRPDGQPGIYGVVHFKNRAIGVLPVEDDGRIWLVGQHRYPLDVYSWEIPEGGGPLDEAPIEAAIRELREETGLIAAIVEPVGGPIHLSNSVSDEVGFLFRASGLTQGPSDQEGTERIHARCVPWDDAWRMVERGEITDSLTLIALLHERVRRAEGGS